MTPEKPFSVLLADYLQAALIDYNNGSAEDTRNAENACGLVLAEYERAVNDLSEDLHSAARCGQPGPKACPGCVIDGLREELDRANTATKQVAAAAETEITRLNAALAEVRTGKSRVYDGVDRRGWTDAQWLEEARSIFYDAGGAGDLLNGHISAMWKQITTAKHEQEQLVVIVAATLRQLGTVLGVNIGEEIRKHVSAGPSLSGTGPLATPTESSAELSNVESESRADGPEQTDEPGEPCAYCVAFTVGSPATEHLVCGCAKPCGAERCNAQSYPEAECWDCGSPMWQDRFGGWHHSRGAKDHRARTDPYATEASSVSAQAEAGGNG